MSEEGGVGKWKQTLRKGRWAAVPIILVLALLAYYGWALVGAVQIGRLALRGNAAAVAEYVDLRELRWSIAHQIVRAYLAHSGKFQKKLDPIERGMALGMATTAADSLLESILTPVNVVALLERGRFAEGPEAEFEQMPRFAYLLRHPSLSIVLRSYFTGPRTFVVVVADDKDDSYGLRLHLSGMRWQLSGLDLPEAMCDRLARKAIEKARKAGQQGG